MHALPAGSSGVRSALRARPFTLLGQFCYLPDVGESEVLFPFPSVAALDLRLRCLERAVDLGRGMGEVT